MDRPTSFSLDELRKCAARSSSPASSARATVVRCKGLSGNGRWTGVPLRAVLDQAGVKPRRASSSSSAPITAKRKWSSDGQKFKVDQQFGRSLSREKALSPEPFLAYALNGEPLTATRARRCG